MKPLRIKFVLIALTAVFLLSAAQVDAQRYPSKFVKNKLNTVEFYWNVGVGLATDTTLLSTDVDYGKFYYTLPESLYVTSLDVALKAGINGLGTDTLSVQICFSDTIADYTPTKLRSTDMVVQDTTLGVSYTSFTNDVIETGKYVWLELGDITLGRKPVQVIVTMEATKQD